MCVSPPTTSVYQQANERRARVQASLRKHSPERIARDSEIFAQAVEQL
jgi:hypothetical protein